MNPISVADHSPLGLTDSYRGAGAETPPPTRRCRVTREADGSQFLGEMEVLLRQRLRLAALIMLGPLVFFLVRTLISADTPFSVSTFYLVFHAVAILAVAVTACVLWSRLDLSLCLLREIELGMFGILVAFFGWMQFEAFYHDELYQLIDRIEHTASGKHYSLLEIIAASSAIRWVILIVIYGVFIPNTWKRCLWLVTGGALTPIVLSAAAAALAGRMNSEILTLLSILFVLMATAVAIAVFGSYRLQVLHQLAFKAQQLGQYRLKKRLGAGGMGEVYLAEHLMLRRPCAVKLIRAEQAGDRTTLQRFEREVRAMATLTHWNTVEVYDYGHAEDGTFYYVMEYLPGHNLEKLVERHGPLPPGRVIHLLRQVCQALREAHGVGLLHRDIKPSNLITCERGGVCDVVKLLDFGLVYESRLSQAADKLTMVGTILGSPPYMSPEQAAGKQNLSPASDIYSLGGVAYYMLTGQAPFERDTVMQVFLAHAYEAVVPPSQVRPDIPSDLEAIVLRCLSKKPEDRFASAEGLNKALARCRSAEEWTEESAATWWKQPDHRTEMGTAEITSVPTRVTTL